MTFSQKTFDMTSHKKSTFMFGTAAVLISCFALVGEVLAKGRPSKSKAAISVKQVNPRAIGYQTSERDGLNEVEGTWDEFYVVLKSQPLDRVTIALDSDDKSEGTVDRNQLVFNPANWDIPQIVRVTGVNDGLTDGNVSYTIVLDPASSADPDYDGLDPEDVPIINIDDETFQTDVLYVSYLEIAEMRQRGPSTDVRFAVDTNYADGTIAADVTLVISVYDSFQTDLNTTSNIRNFLLATDSNGQVVTPWLKGLGSGVYRVEVHDMWLVDAPYLWDPFNDLDVRDDEDGDGRPDFAFTVD